jgi:hypothetical protein
MSTTWFQYAAHSLRPYVSHRYTRLRMSFWKHEPPNPTDGCRNRLPMRSSIPTARLISLTSAPVASHKAEMELIDDTRCAKKALATSLESSELHKLVVKICSRGTQCEYTDTRRSAAASPASVCCPPMRTRSGLRRSAIAVPSARNSGLDKTW